MKIVVAIKQVPARDVQLKLDAQATWIETAELSYEINEPDAYALEAAAQLKEKHGGEVVALCAGPESVAISIREALAKGADRAIHIVEDNLAAYDALSMARLLTSAVARESPDLVLTGLQSSDMGSGQTGVILAELLGVPHATIIMSIEAQNSTLRVKRELEGGWFQYVTLPTPALLTIQSGISKLRYATLMGIKKAKTKETKQVTAAELGVAPAPQLVLERVSLPRKSKQTTILEGSPEQQAAALVEKLKFEARVL